METQTQKPLMDVREVAKLLDVSERTIYTLDAEGKMPNRMKVGNLNRWRRAELMQWIEQGCPAVAEVA